MSPFAPAFLRATSARSHASTTVASDCSRSEMAESRARLAWSASVFAEGASSASTSSAPRSESQRSHRPASGPEVSAAWAASRAVNDEVAALLAAATRVSLVFRSASSSELPAGTRTRPRSTREPSSRVSSAFAAAPRPDASRWRSTRASAATRAVPRLVVRSSSAASPSEVRSARWSICLAKTSALVLATAARALAALAMRA